MPRLPVTVSNAGTTTQAIVARPSSGQGIEQTGDRAAQAAQTNARSQTKGAQALPFGDGNLIKGVAHSAGVGSMFAHLLGRQAAGAFPVYIKLSVTAPKWAISSLGTNKDGRITAITDTDATIDWWVF